MAIIGMGFFGEESWVCDNMKNKKCFSEEYNILYTHFCFFLLFVRSEEL